MHRAVQAPGLALPSWQILCRIAQKMGIAGFEFENAAQIQAELEKLPVNDAELLPSTPEDFRPNLPLEHSYMGFPLGTWVAGFRLLYPGEMLSAGAAK